MERLNACENDAPRPEQQSCDLALGVGGALDGDLDGGMYALVVVHVDERRARERLYDQGKRPVHRDVALEHKARVDHLHRCPLDLGVDVKHELERHRDSVRGTERHRHVLAPSDVDEPVGEDLGRHVAGIAVDLDDDAVAKAPELVRGCRVTEYRSVGNTFLEGVEVGSLERGIDADSHSGDIGTMPKHVAPSAPDLGDSSAHTGIVGAGTVSDFDAVSLVGRDRDCGHCGGQNNTKQ